jgi:hypothetical protein
VTSLGDGLLARLDFVDAERPDPVDWVGDRLGGEMWSRQRDIARSVAANPRTAVQSAHSTGKSWLAARLVAWWIDSHPVGSAFALTSAPTQTQVNAILWQELRRAHVDGGLQGRLTSGSVPRWMIGDEIVALGRKTQDLTDPEEAAAQLQGIHARHLLIVLDEAAGLAEWIWDAAEAMATNEHARILAIGNPTDPGSRFAKACAPGSGWEVLEVSAFCTPAFTGEEVSAELLEQLVSPEWVQRMRKQWGEGEGSARWTSRVLGQFPEEADDALISRAWVKAAQERSLPVDVPGTPGAYGCDIARGGGDETVVYLNRGGCARLAHRSQGHELMRTTGAIVALVRDGGRSWPAVVDSIGIGAGVFDRLREQGVTTVGFVASERARRPDRFKNRRAELGWDLREALREGLLDLDPADDELATQLLALRFFEDSSGRIQLESKASMKSRGVGSPDRADALAMSLVGGRWRPERVLSDEERAARELERALAEMDRAQRQREMWLGLPPPIGWTGGSVMNGVMDMDM